VFLQPLPPGVPLTGQGSSHSCGNLRELQQQLLGQVSAI